MREPTSSRAAITAVASYVPERILTNAELARTLDTSDEWIVTRTGIRERRVGKPRETTSTMGAGAGPRLLGPRGLGPAGIDPPVGAAITPGMLFPAPARPIPDQLRPTPPRGFD